MRSEKLKGFFEDCRFKNVHTVIASGNVIFDSPSVDVTSLETKIEKSLPKKLQFESTVFVRSQDELQKLVRKDPFRGVKDEKPNYLVVTFKKNPRKEVCTVIDLNKNSGTEMMRIFEKEHGKNITTRTWKTVHRILKKMESV